MMGDAFMAIDTGQSRLQPWHHALLRGRGHLMNVHGARIMAIAALARIGRLHGSPDIFGQFQPVLFEFLRRADGAEHFVPQLVAGLDLAPNLEPPVTRDVAVGTGRPHAELILEVNGLLVFLINGIAHLVAGGAKTAACWLPPFPS